MELEQIVMLIYEKIGPLLDPSEGPKFWTWLNRLKDDDFDSNRLLVCLGIDINHDLVDLETLKNVISDAVKNHETFISPIEPFELSSKKVDLLKCSNCCDPNFRNSRYVYIMAWGKFQATVLSQIYEGDITDMDYLHYRDSTKYAIDLIAEANNSVVSLSGGNNIVWVAPFDEFDEAVASISPEQLASHLCDKYGLPMRTGLNPYIACLYPMGHDVLCKQPTSINADWKWKEGLFLSYRKHDSFGRTYSIASRDANSGKERVHEKMEIRFSDLEKMCLGYTEMLKKDIEYLIKHGQTRVA